MKFGIDDVECMSSSGVLFYIDGLNRSKEW